MGWARRQHGAPPTHAEIWRSFEATILSDAALALPTCKREPVSRGSGFVNRQPTKQNTHRFELLVQHLRQSLKHGVAAGQHHVAHDLLPVIDGAPWLSKGLVSSSSHAQRWNQWGVSVPMTASKSFLWTDSSIEVSSCHAQHSVQAASNPLARPLRARTQSSFSGSKKNFSAMRSGNWLEFSSSYCSTLPSGSVYLVERNVSGEKARDGFRRAGLLTPCLRHRL